MDIHTEEQHQKPTRGNPKHAGSKTRPPKRKQLNPLQKGIHEFITSNLTPSVLSEFGISLNTDNDAETLLSTLPKRFTIYDPMLLLSSNALTAPPQWGALYASLSTSQRETLFRSIAQAFKNHGVTHIAINAPIAAIDASGGENRMRSPVGLVPLYGDFGTPPLAAGEGEESKQPSELDFNRAFWVRTIQNHGIVQIWAPLYTMFSRGNVTEKARILGQGGRFDGLDEMTGLRGETAGEISVVDMYAGIGYFVFSYLKRGVKRVWGWEINGWSVEGLRRGCEANGWGCMVVRVRDDGAIDATVEELVERLGDEVRVVIFHGDNKFAAGILDEIKRRMDGKETWNSIRHVNLGLLPSSSSAWENACNMVDGRFGGWVHVHENVDVRDINRKRDEIVVELGKLWREAQGHQIPVEHTVAECRHVEEVKTYAPGVMHCVFDIELLSPGIES